MSICKLCKGELVSGDDFILEICLPCEDSVTDRDMEEDEQPEEPDDRPEDEDEEED